MKAVLEQNLDINLFIAGTNVGAMGVVKANLDTALCEP